MIIMISTRHTDNVSKIVKPKSISFNTLPDYIHPSTSIFDYNSPSIALNFLNSLSINKKSSVFDFAFDFEDSKPCEKESTALNSPENMEIEQGDEAAKIIINSRTGTIVVGQNVKVSPVAITHGSLTVTVSETLGVSQPNALAAGDTVVYSSRIIPGNEKAIIETRNLLIDQGINIITDRDTLVHVSGHPRQNELKAMYDWLKPEICIPVHGESAHLNAHAKLAGEIGIPQVVPVRNGDMVRLAPGLAEIVDEIPHGRYYKDGEIFGDESEIGVSQRRKLSYVGMVSLSIVLDHQGNVADEIDIELYGLPDVTNDGEEFDDVLYHAANEALVSIPRKRRKDPEIVRNAVKSAVRSKARDLWGKKPVTIVFVAVV